MKLRCESLESRECPAFDVQIGAADGVLRVYAMDVDRVEVLVSPDPNNPGRYQVYYHWWKDDGWDEDVIPNLDVTGGRVEIYGSPGADSLENQTGLNELIRGGDGADYIVGGTGTTDIHGGYGDDEITTYAGGGQVTTGYAFGGDVDTVYSNSSGRVLIGAGPNDVVIAQPHDFVYYSPW